MLSTGTTNRDCCIFFSFLHEARKHKIDHAYYMGKVRGKISIGFYIGRNLGVQAG